MIQFGQLGYTGLPDQQQSAIYVGTMRKDGRIPCTYVFPISGKRLSKLLTLEQLQAERDGGKYKIIGQ